MGKMKREWESLGKDDESVDKYPRPEQLQHQHPQK
jgi:hypothetical protein